MAGEQRMVSLTSDIAADLDELRAELMAERGIQLSQPQVIGEAMSRWLRERRHSAAQYMSPIAGNTDGT